MRMHCRAYCVQPLLPFLLIIAGLPQAVLAADDFLSPGLTPAELQPRLGTPEAPLVVDLRAPVEFGVAHIPGAINIPLYFIRLKLNTLEQGKKYVVCCDTGRRSSAGAYILSERGYHAYVLRGGINQDQA